MNVRNQSPTLSGFLLAAAGAALFSLKPVLIKLVLSEKVDTITLLMLRMAFSLPIYIGLGTFLLRNRSRQPVTAGLSLTPKWFLGTFAAGILGYYVAMWLDFESLNHISAQLERITLFAYPTFVLLMGWAFFRQKVTSRKLLALALSYLGIVVIFAHDLHSYGDRVSLGAALVLAAALVFAIYTLVSKELIHRAGSLLFTCVSLSGAGLAILMNFFLVHGIRLLISASAYFGSVFYWRYWQPSCPASWLRKQLPELDRTKPALSQPLAHRPPPCLLCCCSTNPSRFIT